MMSLIHVGSGPFMTPNNSTRILIAGGASGVSGLLLHTNLEALSFHCFQKGIMRDVTTKTIHRRPIMVNFLTTVSKGRFELEYYDKQHQFYNGRHQYESCDQEQAIRFC